MILYTPVTRSNFIDHFYNYVFACQNKKSKIYQEFANFCEISLFIYFIFLVIKLFLPWGGGGRGRGAVHGRMVVGFPLAMQFGLIISEL